MQLKGLVKFFTIALILYSLWRLSFTFIANSTDKKINAIVDRQIAATSANLSESEKDLLYESTYNNIVDSMQNKEVFNLLGLKYTYAQVKDKELQLGLDLQGGMSVTLEVGLDGLIKSMSNNDKDGALLAALNEANNLRSTSNEDYVTIFGKAYAKANPNGKLAPLFTKSSQKSITLSSTNEEVLSIIRTEAKEAINRTHQILSTRIDKFGVASPAINLDEAKGVITVELAGVKNPESVRKYLQATAKLQFWEVATLMDIGQSLGNANEASKNYLKSIKGIDTVADATPPTVAEDTVKAEVAKSEDTTQSLASTLEGSLSDLNSKDTKTATDDDINKGTQDESLFSYMVPMVDESGRAVEGWSNIGIAEKRNAKKILEILNSPQVKRHFRSDIKFLIGENPAASKDAKNETVGIYAIKTNNRDVAKLEGDHITDARFDFSQTGTPTISLSMDEEGASKWAKLTKDNIGRPIAIALDDFVYTAPRVNQEITGGNSQITGSFTPKEGTEIANILKTGKLPAPAKIVQEQVVGPTLGQESIDGSIKAFTISFLAIFVLMIIYYNTAGIIANIALVLNVIFTFAIFAELGGTLTMAGIAGIILGIGMAVDANVIIFERIKEELALGKTHEESVKLGYQHSYAPVLDGHVTSLITAFILLYFGLGPIKGFATTQIIALLLSLFTGIIVSRLITDIYTQKGRHFKYFTKFSKGIFQKANFQFIKARKIGYVISTVLMLLGVAAFFNGFDYGVEFSGGRMYTVALDKKVAVNDIRHDLQPYLENHPVVKTLGNNNHYSITTDLLIHKPDVEVGNEVLTKLYTGLKEKGYISNDIDFNTFEAKTVQGIQSVSPLISKDLVNGAKWATIMSVIAICIYIFLRFRKFQYSVGTIISLVHDALITVAVFSFFRNIVPFSLEIDQHFIAALLTIIGFSMNDTVIVYDRAREYFRKEPNGDKKDIVNRAINSTLTRTIMTSFTLFLVAVILFIFGGEVLRGFAFAMSIGVLVATYSSIFIAAPLLIDLDKKNTLSLEEDKEERIRKVKEQA
jgi:SecD/SecF fusion protein